MTKIQEETSKFIRFRKLKEYSLKICRCEKYVCIMLELREYEILERAI